MSINNRAFAKYLHIVYSTELKIRDTNKHSNFCLIYSIWHNQPVQKTRWFQLPNCTFPSQTFYLAWYVYLLSSLWPVSIHWPLIDMTGVACWARDAHPSGEPNRPLLDLYFEDLYHSIHLFVFVLFCYAHHLVKSQRIDKWRILKAALDYSIEKWQLDRSFANLLNTFDTGNGCETKA